MVISDTVTEKNCFQTNASLHCQWTMANYVICKSLYSMYNNGIISLYDLRTSSTCRFTVLYTTALYTVQYTGLLEIVAVTPKEKAVTLGMIWRGGNVTHIRNHKGHVHFSHCISIITLFSTISHLQKYYHPTPPFTTLYAHAQYRKLEKSTTQEKTTRWSISTYWSMEHRDFTIKIKTSNNLFFILALLQIRLEKFNT